MTECEILDLTQTTIASMGQSFTMYLSIVSGYLIIVAELSRSIE